MTLQLGQVVEGVGIAQLTSVNQAHEQVAHLRPIQRPIERSRCLQAMMSTSSTSSCVSTLPIAGPVSCFVRFYLRSVRVPNRSTFRVVHAELHRSGRGLSV